MSASVVSALRWWARTKGQQAALRVGDDEVGYRGLQDWTSRVARWLAAQGVRPGDRVCVLGGNSVEWCATAVGVLKAGAVLVPLNPRLVAAEIRKITDDAGAVLIIAAPELRSLAEDAAAAGPPLPVAGFAEVAAMRDGPGDDHAVEIGEDDPAMILFTSGTTGLSKGVVCTNRTLLSIVFEASLTEAGLRPGSRTLLVLPLAFTPGLVWGLAMTLVLGGTIVVEREFDPGRAVRLIDEHGIDALFGVPLIFGAMAKSPEFATAQLSSLKTALTGGAAVPVPLLEAWGSKGVKLRQIYGMTEAGGVATSTGVDDAAAHPDTCGTGSIFTEFKVVREDGSACEPGEPGEIILRGPGVTPGYWQDPENTARALREGWLHSGDLGVTTEDGRLKFVDRIKDLIISGGINISPIEIEQVISGLDDVEEVAVISAADEKFGETPAAIVVSRGHRDPHRIVTDCGRLLADYKIPRYVVFRDEPLPRLPSGKLAKVAIRKEYADIPSTHPKVR
ncbi:class I adenylate-forming enzyme family protein [Amycolatopsis methanolica]|uniref:Long fatty acid CoA ligase n=1 Tax=Amycolatopsis methanolica 239 TaxID=1068978 RepID=A0A076N0G1_AMYME|nr:AMP-binding protein [Amycolatopsis methanolica]AIJ23297.1 long fatty acid CoA ligase [Amycolatopsis methanolica 239]